jgi:succinate dehydrogenase/fumarate reductase flavoprotein subunit
MKLNNLLVLVTCFQGAFAKPKPVNHEVDVVIVGGGATGAYAAVRLREDYGKSVLVIEKQNRLVSPSPLQDDQVY